MKKIYILIFLLYVGLISGCANNPGEIAKQDFFVNTMVLGVKDQQSFIIKPGKIVGSQDITVTSQVNGRVDKILVKEGDDLLGGKQVISLADTVANYNLQVQSAKNSLDRAILTYEQNKNLLEQQLKQAEINYEQAKNSYNVASKTSEQSLKKAQIDMRNVDTNLGNLKLQLDIEKTNNVNISDNVLYQADTIFGVTDKYKHMNDSFEIYLGAKDSSQKNLLESLILKMYKTKDSVKSIRTQDISETELYDSVIIISNSYLELNILLDNIVRALQNSVSSVALPQSTIDNYINFFYGQKNSLQSLNNAFTAYRKQIESTLGVMGTGFVDNTKENIELAYESTLISAQNNLFNAEVGLKNAKLSLDTLSANYYNQLGLLNNAIEAARIGYINALTQYNKLSIRSPIQGIIGNIFVDKGQEVSMGTPLFTITNKNNQLVEIYVSLDEYKYLKTNQGVLVYYDDSNYISGEIVSVNPVANRDFSYKVIISLLQNREVLGDIARVHIPLQIGRNILPLSSVVITKKNEGYINVLKNGELEKYRVVFGNVWGEFIEIVSDLPDGLEIVLSIVDNFDPEDFVIKVRQ